MIDIFGKILKAYLNGESLEYTIRRNDGGIIDVFNTGIYFTNYSDWEDYEKEIISKYVRGKVLDVGAGAGRHSIFLQDRGYDVHAIDISPSAIQLMKIRGIKNTYLMDLRKLDFPENYFNSVLIMFADLGLAGSIKDTKELLKSLYKITTPEGRIITTLRDPYNVSESKYFVHHAHPRKGAKLVDKIRARIEYNGDKGDWFYLLMASPQELRRLITRTGWDISNIIKGRDGFYGAVLKKSPLKMSKKPIHLEIAQKV